MSRRSATGSRERNRELLRNEFVTDIIKPTGSNAEFADKLEFWMGQFRNSADGRDVPNPLVSDSMDNAAFDAAEFKHEFLIDGLLVANEPGVFCAPSKSMKTALSC